MRWALAPRETSVAGTGVPDPEVRSAYPAKTLATGRREASCLARCTTINKYRAAIEILQKGRDVLVADLANEILDREEDLAEGGFLLNEFLESQGSRLHFLSLLVGQLEVSAETLEEARPAPKPKKGAKSPSSSPRRPRSKKITEQTAGKGSTDEL